MKTPAIGKSSLLAACLLLGAAGSIHAQNIYKCTQGGKLEYTDHPCPGHTGELIHQADDGEVIDQYLDLGQDDIAKRYATTHHLEALYKERLDAYQQKVQAKAAKDAMEAKQHDEQARQQALAAEATERERLRAENDALRQQNDDYRDQLAQPVDNSPPVVGYAPSYWAPPYRDHGHDHDPGNGHGHDPGNGNGNGHGHDHDPGNGNGSGHGPGNGHDPGQHPPAPPPQPVVHPCRQIAGDQSIC